jgi:hypothetical protein
VSPRDAVRASGVAGAYVVVSTGFLSLWSRLLHFGHGDVPLVNAWVSYVVVALALPAAMGFSVARLLDVGRPLVAYEVALGLGPLLATFTRIVLDDVGASWVLGNLAPMLLDSALSGAVSVVVYVLASRLKPQGPEDPWEAQTR